MVNRRPHILKFKLSASTPAPYQNGNGDWVIPETSFEQKELKCRAEPNGAGRVIASADGQNIVYSWVIYLDRNADELPYGHEVEVLKGSKLIAKGTVKLFSPGQMNARIWV